MDFKALNAGRVVTLRAIFMPALIMAVGLGGCSRTETVPPAPPGGVYRSTSAGASFEQSVAIAGQPGEYVANFSLSKVFRSERKPGVIFAAAGGNGIIRSDDYGVSWTIVPTPLTNVRDVVELINGVLVATGADSAGQGFVIRSLDQGLSWNSVFTIPVPVDEDGGFTIVGNDSGEIPSVVLSLAIDPFNADRVYAGSNLGTIFIGEQSAKVWRTMHDLSNTSGSLTGLGGLEGVKKMVASPHIPGELLVITSDQRLLRIRDAGSPDPEANAIHEEIVVPSPGTDGGAFFSVAPDEEVFDVTFVDQFPEAILVGIRDGIAVSRDAGLTWKYPAIPLETRESFNSVVANVSPTNPNRFLVAVNSVVYRSEDGGRTWNSFALGLNTFKITDLSIDPENAARVLLITEPLQK